MNAGGVKGYLERNWRQAWSQGQFKALPILIILYFSPFILRYGGLAVDQDFWDSAELGNPIWRTDHEEMDLKLIYISALTRTAMWLSLQIFPRIWLWPKV